MNGEADFKEFESRLKFETRLKFEFNVLIFIYTCSSNLCFMNPMTDFPHLVGKLGRTIGF